MEKPIKAFITEITFNDGEKLTINQNDIVLFVGPNNVGKSQSLNDIYTKCGSSQASTVVIKSIQAEKQEGSLLSLLSQVTVGTDNGKYWNYTVNRTNYSYNKQTGDQDFLNSDCYGQYKDLFVSHLTTEARLSTCRPASNINRNEPKTHPIHYAAFDYKYLKWLSESFHKAFEQDLNPNITYGASIPLCIGPTPILEKNYTNEIERQADLAKILESYKQVQNQGDGIKSFTGILLNLMLDYYCTHLIDEPESFLHPPQARIMGQIIGNSLKNDQQAFISTHSEDIVKGLLDVCEERLKIIRITRKDDTNSFSILDNDKIKEVFADPLLKYSNIMSSLFHKTVVLCESDSDCKLYSIVENHLKQSEGKYSETLFIHCGGKQRMAKTAEALLALNIDVRLIPDIDVLNDETIIERISKVFGLDWASVKTDYNIFVSGLHSQKEKIQRNAAKAEIDNVLNGSLNNELSKNEIKRIQDAVKVISKWDGIKHGGKQVIPNGEATRAFNNLNNILREHKIYLVPVGELEGFVKEVSGHGPEWVNDVLEKYPDISDDVYKTVREFIGGIGL